MQWKEVSQVKVYSKLKLYGSGCCYYYPFLFYDKEGECECVDLRTGKIIDLKIDFEKELKYIQKIYNLTEDSWTMTRKTP